MTKSGKRFNQARRVEIETAKRVAEEKIKAEVERKARIASIQDSWFKLTA